MNPSILIIHGFSAKNLGDGLLVEETIAMAREAFGSDVRITALVQHPDTFNLPGVEVLRAGPNRRGYSLRYLRTLLRIKTFDAVFAVGGGYLRFGTPVEALKCLLVHGPQLVAASWRGRGVFYLPQSVGPARWGTARVLIRLLSRVDRLYLRDHRSMTEIPATSAIRFPDLATLDVKRPEKTSSVEEVPVLTIRAIHGKVPEGVYEMASRLCVYDSYIQSTTGGNDDRPATSTLSPRRILSRQEYLASEGPRRVVIAVRLHAALMAMRAGHYVIHLSYERKGFGAFQDLGLDEFVHNVNDFSVDQVLAQAQSLIADSQAREAYDQLISRTSETRSDARRRIISQLRTHT